MVIWSIHCSPRRQFTTDPLVRRTRARHQDHGENQGNYRVGRRSRSAEPGCPSTTRGGTTPRRGRYRSSLLLLFRNGRLLCKAVCTSRIWIAIPVQVLLRTVRYKKAVDVHRKLDQMCKVSAGWWTSELQLRHWRLQLPRFLGFETPLKMLHLCVPDPSRSTTLIITAHSHCNGRFNFHSPIYPLAFSLSRIGINEITILVFARRYGGGDRQGDCAINDSTSPPQHPQAWV
ncbi:hypothetical protein M413DRAFT_261189 [Hebeloma cylindrosporum]|uniref:Uncharacterized protein n=1 Tax=Hebeloma cylindrosporum TaxID=76867 RepID=A0A0C2YA56_HEBCY|nr:hypothetical protein M413DRAFT_261189 [Hebeloma cylindrosporum h7]